MGGAARCRDQPVSTFPKASFAGGMSWADRQCSGRGSSETGTAFLTLPPPARRSSAQVPAAARPAFTVAVANALMAAPAMAEAGKIFDFNLTLPIMAGQFLLLMIVMDGLVYKPVSKVLDERDADLRKKVEAVKDNSSELAKFTVRTLLG